MTFFTKKLFNLGYSHV